jgi:predicted SAM-dependent methyltransferase
MSDYSSDSLKQLRHRIKQASPKKIVVGAGDLMHSPEWICTNVEELDITSPQDFYFLFQATNSVDFFFAEHVFEHFTGSVGYKALENIFNYLKPGGVLRIAVPDGNFPSSVYIDGVKPGGTGAGAKDHKMLFNYRILGLWLKEIGFKINILEFWDDAGNFHFKSWSDRDAGKVLRSLENDERNSLKTGHENGWSSASDWDIRYTSLIIDAIKP